MIGHQLNGCTIVAAAPGVLSDTYTILAVVNDKVKDPNSPGDPYVTAWVSVQDMPAPSYWNTGHYFQRFEDAIEDYQERVVQESLPFARGVGDFLAVHLDRKQKED